MLKSIAFSKDHRCFKKGEVLSFRPGVNLLVGDQGTGKSTVLQLLRGYRTQDVITVDADPIKLSAFDFERDNPRGKGWFVCDEMAQLAMMYSSHGEVVLAILRALRQIPPPRLSLLDEPDMALSIRSCVSVVTLLKELASVGYQLIAAVHNPVIILAFDQVLNLESRTWMASEGFVHSHGWEPELGGLSPGR